MKKFTIKNTLTTNTLLKILFNNMIINTTLLLQQMQKIIKSLILY